MTNDVVSMLQKDVERLEVQVGKIPALESDVKALSREVGQLRLDATAGIARIETQLDKVAAATDSARDEARVWMTRFGWTIAGSAIAVILTALVTRAFL